MDIQLDWKISKDWKLGGEAKTDGWVPEDEFAKGFPKNTEKEGRVCLMTTRTFSICTKAKVVSQREKEGDIVEIAFLIIPYHSLLIVMVYDKVLLSWTMGLLALRALLAHEEEQNLKFALF